MKEQHDQKRRQFLRNASLAAIAGAIIPGSVAASSTSKKTEDAALDCDPTTLDYYGAGPFYTDNPPDLTDGQLADSNEAGTRMIISGRVFNLDCNEALPETKIDIWHANDAGAYDNDGFNLRGVVYSNAQGFYMFETIMPGKYLNGAQFRPSHIHFKITPPSFPELTTQLYFEGDTSIPSDAAASIDSGQYDATARIIPLTTNSVGILEGTWDITVDGEGIPTSTGDIHLNKGMIYEVGPNPFKEEIAIRYGVFQKSKIALQVYDMQGQLVADLEEQVLSPEKYTAVWAPDTALSNGHYFITLKVNDLQVHYLKAVLNR